MARFACDVIPSAFGLGEQRRVFAFISATQGGILGHARFFRRSARWWNQRELHPHSQTAGLVSSYWTMAPCSRQSCKRGFLPAVSASWTIMPSSGMSGIRTHTEAVFDVLACAFGIFLPKPCLFHRYYFTSHLVMAITTEVDHPVRDYGVAS